MEIDRKQLRIKVGKFARGPSTALADPRWLGWAQRYRRTASARMIPLDKRGLERRVPESDYHVSRKVDGEFSLLVVDEGEGALINAGGTVSLGLPLLEETVARLAEAGLGGTTVLVGEVYADRKTGGRPRVHDVTRLLRSPGSTEALGEVRFGVFDVICWDGVEITAPFDEVWRWMETVFSAGRLVHPVESVWLRRPEALVKQYEVWVEGEGAEGIVVRSEEAGQFKVKPRHTLDAVAVGFTESLDERAGLLHDVLLALVRDDGSFQILGRVGGGFREEQRREILSDLQDLAAESDYAEVNSERVAYQMVRPERVMEISCLDIIAQTTRGGTINRMVLRWDAEARCWRTERRMPLASLLSPEFLRFREDKRAVPEDVGLSQLTRLVEIEEAETGLGELRLPSSELLRRVVYTKELKGNTMVRKLLLWKTHKESVSEVHPAYVLYYTDYSPNRKTALERDVRVSDSREQVDDFWQALSEKAFVRGWSKVSEEE